MRPSCGFTLLLAASDAVALSRHADTPRQLLLEPNPNGSVYLTVPDTHDDHCQSNMVMQNANRKRTRLDK
jgi:hypothetical protein